MLHSQILGPCNFLALQNSLPAIRRQICVNMSYTQNMYQRVWKTFRTTMQCIVGLYSWGGYHEMEKNFGTNLSHSFSRLSNLFPGIGEQQNIKVQFWEFSTHGDIYFVPGKLLELQFDKQLSPNPGETVLYCEKISWTKDLRVQHISIKSRKHMKFKHKAGKS